MPHGRVRRTSKRRSRSFAGHSPADPAIVLGEEGAGHARVPSRAARPSGPARAGSGHRTCLGRAGSARGPCAPANRVLVGVLRPRPRAGHRRAPREPGAYVHALTRTRCGEYTTRPGRHAGGPGVRAGRDAGPDDPAQRGVLEHLTALVLTPDGVLSAAKGNVHRHLPTSSRRPRPRSRAASACSIRPGSLVAIAQPTDQCGVLHPGVVLG